MPFRTGSVNGGGPAVRRSPATRPPAVLAADALPEGFPPGAEPRHDAAMARKTPKRKAAPKRGSARKARRSTRAASRPAKRASPASRARAARPARRRTAALRSVAIPPGEAADRPSLLEGIDVDPPPPTDRDVTEWDGLDSP